MRKLSLILLATVMVAFTGCDLLKDTIKDAITIDVPINPEPIVFNLPQLIPPLQTKAGELQGAETILYETDLNLEVAKNALSGGYTLDHLRSLKLKSAKLKVLEPDSYNMDDLKTVKLYVGDPKTDQPIAVAGTIEGRVLNIVVNDQDLLAKLIDQDLIHIALTGETLPETNDVKVELTLEFTANISAFPKSK